jgi:hypothetical protein
MAKLETYEGTGGQTKIRDEQKFPDREWIKFPQHESTRVSNIVLESSHLKRDTKFGEAIFIYFHDADTGELMATTLGCSVGNTGKRGTVWSRSAIETLLDCDGEDGISNPMIKDHFRNKRMWIGKTQVPGKNYNVFECDFIDGDEPKFDSSYIGEDQIPDEDEDDNGDPGRDSEQEPDEIDKYIAEKLGEGTDALDVVVMVEGKYEIPRTSALHKVMSVKTWMDGE